jgi:hypothetical protein
MLLTLAFSPIFVYFALGLSGLIVFARIVLAWAMSD